MNLVSLLRRLAGAERGLRPPQGILNFCCERMRATKHAPRGPFNVLKRRHGLVEIVECGAGVLVERLRVVPPEYEREIIILAVSASRHGYRSAKQ